MDAAPTDAELNVLRRMFREKSDEELRHSFHAVTPSSASAAPPAPQRMMTRADALEIRRREREEGVDFELFKTPDPTTGKNFIAKVRNLPFTDRMMITGIPVELCSSLNVAIGHAQNPANAIQDFETAITAFESLDNLAKALCVAGFIRPRIVLHESDLDGSDDCWLVSDLHPEERAAYRTLVMRRSAATDEVARLATFPGSAMAEAATG